MKNKAIIRLSGQVQGVNMRASVKMKAVSLDLLGYVKNMEDNSVEITVEGEKDSIEELIRWLNSRLCPGKVEKLEDYWSDPKNEFDDFTIKY